MLGFVIFYMFAIVFFGYLYMSHDVYSNAIESGKHALPLHLYLAGWHTRPVVDREEMVRSEFGAIKRSPRFLRKKTRDALSGKTIVVYKQIQA